MPGPWRPGAIFPEMEDGGHVVLICTPQDLGENLARLERALEELEEGLGPCPPIPAPPCPSGCSPPGRPSLPPRRLGPWRTARGRSPPVPVAPYPPGVPVVAPGERIGKKELAYLRQIGYNTKSEVRVVSRTNPGEGDLI